MKWPAWVLVALLAGLHELDLQVGDVQVFVRFQVADLLGQRQVHLELFVKVQADWRDNARTLKQFGY